MLKALRLVRIHGCMVERRDGLYHLGGNQPERSQAMGGWKFGGGRLVKHGERYHLTEKGWRATGEADSDAGQAR